MVIDSSALTAIVLGEHDAEIYATAIDAAIRHYERIYIPATVLVETGAVVDRRGRAGQFDMLLARLSPEVIPIDSDIATLARMAARIYGKGVHPAKLNFGDCFSYAVCRRLEQKLLFKGNDFTHTDVPSAL